VPPTHWQQCQLGPGLEAAEIAAALAQPGRNHQLAAEVAIITGETKTDAVIQSLKERLDRLRLQREARAVK
jgi:hypothetical protein